MGKYYLIHIIYIALILFSQQFLLFFFAYAYTEYALSESSFRYYRNEIDIRNIEAMSGLANIPREKWTQAHYEDDVGAIWQPTLLINYRLEELFVKRGHQLEAVLAFD